MPETFTGKIGEHFTAEYLREKGYEIVDMNFKCRFGEIDVIAQNERYLAFVEVKTRKSDGMTHPFEAITPSKRAKVIKTAQYYLMKFPTELQPRFDAAAVFTADGELLRIDYIENAFY
ncbi:MAG: YraN family protein [Clostridia bacterium]|nr:YraN family protein [Clostridia bacterium]